MGKSKLKKMTAKYNGSNGAIRKSEERQATMAEAVGITLKGNFEQRGSGWGNGENKAACFECGGADHFEALCSIWIAKRRKKAGLPVTSQNQNGKQRKERQIQIFEFYMPRNAIR